MPDTGLRYRCWVRWFLPALSALAWLTIAVMALLNPSDTIPATSSGLWAIAALAGSGVLACALPFAVLKGRDKRSFVRRFVSAFIALVSMGWVFALTLHRDFFVYTTQIILILFTILLVRLDEMVQTERRARVLRAVSAGALAAFLLWIGWLMMMSYTIVTRAEPRWIESTAYNLVNGLIGLGLLLTTTTLHDRAKRTVTYRNGSLYLDDRNVSEVLSRQEALLVRAFLAKADHTHTCQSLLRSIRVAADCDRCREQMWTASNCPAYRNLKNRINATKKYLELLQIGTIVPVSESSRDTKESGWRLRLFDDVRLARRASFTADSGRTP